MGIYPNRGKRKDNGTWVTGFFYEDTPLYVFSGDALNIPRQCYILEPGFADWGMPREMVKYQVVPESVGYYTGMSAQMLDMPVIEPIYTGMVVDLTDSHGKRHAVTVKGPMNGAFMYGGDKYSDEPLCNAKDIIIVGNKLEWDKNSISTGRVKT